MISFLHHSFSTGVQVWRIDDIDYNTTTCFCGPSRSTLAVFDTGRVTLYDAKTGTKEDQIGTKPKKGKGKWKWCKFSLDTVVGKDVCDLCVSD